MSNEINCHPSSYVYSELVGLPSEFFALNRKNFLTNLNKIVSGLEQNSIILLEGGNEIPHYDTDIITYHFQQESNFYYLTGVTEPKFYAILDVFAGSLTLFYDLSKDPRDHIFMKVPTLEELKDKYKVPVLDKESLFDEIKKRDPNKIYLLNGTNSDSNLSIKPPALSYPHQDEKWYSTRLDANPYIYEILADTRTRKTPEEISLLSYINKITVEAHLNTIKNIKPSLNERNVENLFFNYAREKYHARIWSYPMLCPCGVSSSILHYENNDKELKDGDLILTDMGIRYLGYTSDVTSTVPVNGKFTKKQADIYNIVLKANRAVRAEMKPGVYWPDMHLLAEKIILEGLKELSLVKGDVTEMLNDRVAYYFMPHGLGHFMGVDTHDVGGYLSFTPKRSELPGLSSLRAGRYLSVGNVITVEPGIYFVKFLLEKGMADEKLSKYFNSDLIKEYYNFGGVRIEDDCVVTMDGCVNLTAGLPREISEIEGIMKKI